MSGCSFPLSWPVSRYHFYLRVTKTMHLPQYAGSAFRGAIGRALRSGACVTRQPSCQSCLMKQGCGYHLLFEGPEAIEHSLQRFSKVPHPYVVEAPVDGEKTLQEGDELSFSIVLFGKALDQLALLIWGVKAAFQKEVCLGSAELMNVWHEQTAQVIYKEGQSFIKTHDPVLHLQMPTAQDVIQLTWQPHLRLQNNGVAYGPHNIHDQALWAALFRRVSLVREFYADRVAFDFNRLQKMAQQVKSNRELSWKTWRRYSSRQNQGMYLGGVVGTWTFYEVPAELYLFLKVGSYLHIGKNASFGLGGYRVDLNQNLN